MTVHPNNRALWRSSLLSALGVPESSPGRKQVGSFVYEGLHSPESGLPLMKVGTRITGFVGGAHVPCGITSSFRAILSP